MLTLGHPTLREVSKLLTPDFPPDQQIIEKFTQYAEKWKTESMGVAAPQLGLPRRAIGTRLYPG